MVEAGWRDDRLTMCRNFSAVREGLRGVVVRVTWTVSDGKIDGGRDQVHRQIINGPLRLEVPQLLERKSGGKGPKIVSWMVCVFTCHL